MGDWTNATSAAVPARTASTAGVLRPAELARHVELARHPCGEAVHRWVENHWSLRWDVPAGRWFESQILPHPTCSLTMELGSHPRPDLPPGQTVVVTGVATRRFDVEVRGWGRVVGVRFRPGGLAALTGGDASRWRDRSIPASEVLPVDLCVTLGDPELAGSVQRWTRAAEAGLAVLARAAGAAETGYEQLLAVIADMLEDRSLVAVADVGARHNLSVRTLQRLFRRYVGVGPKWVLARYRLHDLVSELDAGYDGPLTDLAYRFGWYDQAHLIRDFTALVGVTPGQYRAARARAATRT